ncbi:MAG TPA: glycosyltransferase family 2 protein [Fimbriiglobus sp.]|nr:glycosyltransferase family 2 protein [Fimbriiglobus sp.]
MTLLPPFVLAVVLSALVVVGYAYLGYPVIVGLASRFFGRSDRRAELSDDELPTVTLLIAAYNEESEIAQRLHNALTVRYPKGKFEVVIASDGSSDRTVAIARQFTDRRVRVVAFATRRGKSAVLNDVMANHVRSEVVVFSDANTWNDPDSIRRLAAWFRDRSVGVVCGRLVLTDPESGRNVDGLYWKYETFLKTCEGRLGALLGSNGGIYAIRRTAYTPIPDNTLVDDFVIPLLARLRTGCRMIYDRDAVAAEETPGTMTAEFHRRARIGAGGFQSLGILRRLLLPGNGWVAFTFFSHKVLRWTSPFFLLAALAGSVLLTALDPGYWWLTAGQLAFYGLALAAGRVPNRPRFLRVLRLPALFTTLNAAFFVGFFRWLRGPANGTWRRTARAEPVQTPVPALSFAGLTLTETVIDAPGLALHDTVAIRSHRPPGRSSKNIPVKR